MSGQIYPDGTVFQLLVKGSTAASIVNEWWDTCIRADIRVRRAKTQGHVVIETTDPVFASHVIQVWKDTKVNIKEPK